MLTVEGCSSYQPCILGSSTSVPEAPLVHGRGMWSCLAQDVGLEVATNTDFTVVELADSLVELDQLDAVTWRNDRHHPWTSGNVDSLWRCVSSVRLALDRSNLYRHDSHAC